MNIFVYSDESGVFDFIHNDIFVFGGVVFLGKNDKDINERKFVHVENLLRKSSNYQSQEELKACKISLKDKRKLFRSLNNVIKFGAVINQKKVLPQIFGDKKSKQRFLDYAYKIALKRCFENLLSHGFLAANDVENIYIFADEHTTATNGKYELREALEQEFKRGTFNNNYNMYYEPIFPYLNSLNVKFCNSSSTTLVRAADIVANRLYYEESNNPEGLFSIDNFYVTKLPC